MPFVMRLLCSVGIVCAVASTVATANEALIETAKKDVLKKLNDPDSARFSDLSAKEKDGRGIVCGRVNAKNRYGGYEGFRPFLYDPAISVGSIIYGGARVTDDPFSQMAQMKGYEDACGRLN
jgi:hypothetical protein